MEGYKMDKKYRLMFYKKNPIFIKYLRNFFNIEKGVRCRCLLVETPSHIKTQSQNTMTINGKEIRTSFVYRDGSNNDYGFPLTNVIDNYCLNAVTIHFFNSIYNEGILKNNRQQDISSHIIGLTPVFDIDVPKSKSIKDKRDKNDILSKPDYIEDVVEGIKIIDMELKEIDEYENSSIQFSGNGFYVMLDNFYGNIDAIDLYCENFIGLVEDIIQDTGLKIDVWNRDWHRFFKAPYSFHKTYNRISVPLPRDFTYEYLLKYTNPDNYLKGKVVL